ncbi:glycosyl hydrolase 115 family protein [Aliiglaciecola sp. LCG003]|uniref:glycosyl hydrolase 115 family protein n=1 Tax=Aliiglaciecola sp. LCG003 TaxID=3053655 RepID=UPI0025746946|nr:glycosyl hydrolase 115 family protein [Aliiglaciecola sp. LCG003]WJG09537.1 glycosyl hydrolase 115 family protein [Aliiglaciecola sp. LCG003]
MQKIQLTFLSLFLCCVSSLAWANDLVLFSSSGQDFVINQADQASPILIDSAERKGLRMAVDNLRLDLEKVTGEAPEIINQLKKTPYTIIVGTLENSATLQALSQAGKLDTTAITGQWEAYQIQTVLKPFDGVEQALVILGSDMRGAIFGVYQLAESIGVSPWYWWADVPIAQHQKLYVKTGTRLIDWPKVQYRGIFLNDEAPALTGWVQEKYGNYNSEFYQQVFELMLRLKANYLWPAMWNNAFNLDDPNNPQLAHEMGIVMGTSHHEPMMRADKEWNWTGEGKWDYSVNQQNLYQFWQQGAERHKSFDSIFTLGMRGQQDEPMSEGQNIALLERIVADQRSILQDVFQQQDISHVPQVWTLYKEVQGYYENGMRVPDDVTLLWSDDNWGNIRRLPTAVERNRSGGAGVYYHFDYVGGPRSYRWINSTPIPKIWEQMNLAYQYNARKIWITNVGDLKPMELPIDFFLQMAWDPEQFTAQSLPDYLVSWSKQQFGEQHAAEIATLVHGYAKHNGRRKPELVGPNTYSQIVYQEAARVSVELAQLEAQAEKISQQLPSHSRAAFFQLVLHPIQASRIVFELNNSLAKNHLYAAQQRASANQHAQAARDWFNKDAELEKQYHSLNNGKWNHFMSQPHIGYTNWNNPPQDSMPVVHINQPNDVADMGVAIEGSAYAWPQTSSNSWPHSSSMQLDFHQYGQTQRYIDVFNKGTKPYRFEAKPSASWIQISEQSAEVAIEKRLKISVDWAKLKAGHHQGNITIKGAAWGTAEINVTAFKSNGEAISGFVEADGYVSIEAANVQKVKNTENASWQEIPLHGRSQSSMSVFMSPDTSFGEAIENAPYLEYDLYLFSRGEMSLTTLLAPSLNFTDGGGLRFAVALDDNAPVIVDVLKDNNHEDWQQAVEDGVRVAKTSLSVAQPGEHKLRIYGLDPGIVVQKLMLDTGGLKPSYLGPPESQFLAEVKK